jgi:hypothetical protein
MEQIKDIQSCLLYIQQHLKVKKNNEVQMGGANGKRFKYRTAEDIFEAVKPLLGECGATLTVSYDFRQVGTNIYCAAIATLWFKPQQGQTETIKVTAFAREGSDDVEERSWEEQDRYKGAVKVKRNTSLDQIKGGQGSGAAISYACKYALSGMFLIDDGIDLDSTMPEKPPKTAKDYDKEIRDLVKKGNADRAKKGIAYLKSNYPQYNTDELEALIQGK